MNQCNFLLGTKQSIKCRKYDNLPTPELLEASFEAGIRDTVRLGSQKRPLLSLLTQLFYICLKHFGKNEYIHL